MIVACYHPLPLSACMLHFDLVSILFGTSIPTSFENVFTLVSLVSTVCSNTYKPTEFVQSSTSLAYLEAGYLAIVSNSYILSCTNITVGTGISKREGGSEHG